MELVGSKLGIRPRHVLCLTNSQAAVGKKPDQVGAIFRLPFLRRPFGFPRRIAKILTRRQLESFSANSHPRQIRNGITEACAVSIRHMSDIFVTGSDIMSIFCIDRLRRRCVSTIDAWHGGVAMAEAVTAGRGACSAGVWAETAEPPQNAFTR